MAETIAKTTSEPALVQIARDTGKLLAELPAKWAFIIAAAAWTALFHWFGNPTLGYVQNNSMFAWVRAVFEHSRLADDDDRLCEYMPYLVLILFAYQSHRLRAVPKRIWPPALVLLLMAAGLHWVGYCVQQTRISMLAYLLGLFSITGVFWGRQWMVESAFPFGLLIFWIPLKAIFDPITFKLRLLSCIASSEIARQVFNIPIERVGTIVSHPGVNGSPPFQFDIAAACSGIRSATVVLILTITYSFLFLKTWWRRAIVIALSPLLAVGGNVARLTFTFILSDSFGQEVGKMVESRAGFVTFSVSFLAVILVTRWLARSERVSLPVSHPEGLTSAGPVLLFPSLACLAVAMSLSGMAAFGIDHLKHAVRLGKPAVEIVAYPVKDENGAVARTNSIRLPASLPGYKSEQLPFVTHELETLPPDTTYGRRIYSAEDGGLEAIGSVVLMGNDRTSLHKPEYCLNGIGWIVRSKTRQRIQLKDGSEMIVGRLDMVWDVGSKPRPNSSGVYLYWFVADGVRASDYVLREWSMLKDVVTSGEIKRWAYISFFSECRPGEEESLFLRMQALVRAAQPEVEIGKLRNL